MWIVLSDLLSPGIKPFFIAFKPKHKSAIAGFGGVGPENLNIAIDFSEQGIKAFLCIVDDDIGANGKDNLLVL